MNPEVIPVTDPLVAEVLRDFRLHRGGTAVVARLRGEGRFHSAAFPEYGKSDKRVLVEFLSEDEWRAGLPSLAKRWTAALRLPYLLFSLLPLVLVWATYHQQARPYLAGNTLLLFGCVTLLHLGCNLWNDYEDHLRGVDSPESSGGSGVIQKLWIPAIQLRNAAALLFAAGLLLGVWLFLRLPFEYAGRHLLWIGVLGALGAASHSGWPFHYKYFALGEPIVFVLSGPLLTMGASLVYFRDPGYFLWFALVSLPLSFLATLRLHSGNMRNIPFDTMAGTYTIARAVGFRWSKFAWVFLLFSPFFVSGALVLFGITEKSTLFSWLALPLAFLALPSVLKANGPLDPACAEIRRSAVRLHFAFGLIYCISFLIP